MKGLEQLQPNAEERIFVAHIEDLCKQAQRGTVRFTTFLDLRRSELALFVASSLRCEACLFGGFLEAQRQMMALHPEYTPVSNTEFPIEPVLFRFKKDLHLTHRDFLGTLMAQQMMRETVGDILIGEGEAVAFVTRPLLGTILNEVTKVGGVGVRCSNQLPTILPGFGERQQLSGVVSSMRLDGVVALITGESRQQAQRLVEGGRVNLNDRTIEKLAQEVCTGDVLSVRGYGKYMILSEGSATKKGRLRVEFSKYL